MTKTLNNAQLRAVKAPITNHCIISAPPGTGKTEVSIQRIKYLLSNGYSANNILVLTFSVRTIEDLKDKLEAANLPVKSFTFHSFASLVLRKNPQKARLEKDYQIIEQNEQELVIEELLTKLNLDPLQYPLKRVRDYIDGQKQNHLKPRPAATRLSAYNQQLIILHKHYESYCQQSNLVDFTGLLIKMCQLFDEHPTILAQYQSQYPHILCDEYHDVEPLQVELLQRLTRNNHSHLYALVDKYQTIYGFRGSNLNYSNGFTNYFPKAQSYQLTDSYRSGQSILDVANAIVANCQLTHSSVAEGSIPEIPRLRSALGKDYDNPVHLYEAKDDESEADFVANQIKHYIENNQNPKSWSNDLFQIAVLYRNNNQSECIKSALKVQNIPFQVGGDKREDYYNRIEIKDVLAYLRVIANPKNDHALKRIINKPSRRIGKQTIQTLQGISNAQNCSLWESIGFVLGQEQTGINSFQGNPLKSSALKALQRFVKLMHQLRTFPLKNETNRLSTIVERIIKESGLYRYYQHQKKNDEQIKALNELIQISREYEQINTKSATTSLTDFITHIALNTESTTTKTQAVQLMTLHGSKGLQFEIVFIIGVHENKLPFKIAAERGLKAVEEERRLFYVGVTRARKHLILSYSKSSKITGTRFSTNEVSRFIEEIPYYLLINITGKVNNLVSVDNIKNDSQALNQNSSISTDNQDWLNAKQMSERFGNVNERNARLALKNAYEKNIAWRSKYLKVRINDKTKAYEVLKDSLPPIGGIEPIFQIMSSQEKAEIETKKIEQKIKQRAELLKANEIPFALRAQKEREDKSLNKSFEEMRNRLKIMSGISPIEKGELMIDWVTIHQDYDYLLPPLNDGRVVRFDSEGNEEWTSDTKLIYEGSYSSKVQILSKGKRLSMSGNLGRFDREENILNYNFPDTIEIANRILDRKEFKDLPKFSVGKWGIVRRTKKTKQGVYSDTYRNYNGAFLTRIDVMKNYQFKTEKEMKDWLYYALQIHLPYVRAPVKYPKNSVSSIESVVWGEGSKEYLVKAYDKATEFLHHNRGKITTGSYLEKVYEYLRDNHIIRIEIKFTGKLAKMQQRTLGEIMKSQKTRIYDYTLENFYPDPLDAYYEGIIKPLLKDSNKANVEYLMEVSRQANVIFSNWVQGHRVDNMFKERTIRKYAKIIRETMGEWADIRRPPPKRPFDGITKITMPSLAESPGDFYRMPNIDNDEYPNQKQQIN